ncbi:NAD(P)H-dependent flavin oxidoreductase [Neobacillus sp. LXY-1]|uniref:NAD(P)H-dependent flavin oxidoreductase n=1 Tax=Neobacillus sp. LXY-1 TaxID=3379133 RepID=UPI003EE1EF90
MMWKNNFTKLLGIEFPLIQAPMAGGVTTPELVAAVSNAGGLGMLGAGYLSSPQLRMQIKEIKARTDKNFGVNLFVPSSYKQNPEKLNETKQLLSQLIAELDVEQPPFHLPTYEEELQIFIEQVDILIEENIPICSFTFGIPPKDLGTKLKDHSSILIGTATTVNEAILNEEAGMDAVVMQGMEAGGHRGTFLIEDQNSLIGLMSLIPQAADHIAIPIIAAGGIMDGRGFVAARCLGASAVQMGTAFLVCEESGANLQHKEAILHANEDQVVLTKAFSGKLARGVKNQFIEKIQHYEANLPDYPLQNELTKAIRKAAVQCGNTEFMSLWSGQSPRLAQVRTVQELFDTLCKEVQQFKF